jgi:gliding motility-associated-like protein
MLSNIKIIIALLVVVVGMGHKVCANNITEHKFSKFSETVFTFIPTKKHETKFFRTPPPVSPDSAALVALYNATAGAAWTTPWDLTKPINEWAGVTIDPMSRRVTKLVLTNRNLVGTLPTTFQGLIELKELRLDNNKLSGTVPVSIAGFKELTLLYLHNNTFSGTLAADFATLTKLKQLNLSFNRFNNLPDFPATNGFTELAVDNNRLGFASLEKNIAIAILKYSPQDSLSSDTIVIFKEGDPVTVPTVPTITGTANSYSWFRLVNGAFVAVPQSGADLTFADVTVADAGTYQLRVTSSIVPNLTLIRRFIRLRVNPCTVSKSSIKESMTYCQGDELPTLTGDEAQSGIGMLKVRYQWQRSIDSMTWIDVGQLKDYQITGIIATTWYRRLASDGRCKTDTSNTVKINFLRAIGGNTVSNETGFLCDATKPDSLKGSIPTGGDGKPQYLWQSSLNRRTWQDEDRTQSYFPIISADTMYFRRIVSSNTCGKPDTSAVLRIVVAKTLPKNEIANNQFVCPAGVGMVMKDSISDFKVDSLSFKYAWQQSEDQMAWTRADTTRIQSDTLYYFTPKGITKTTYFRRMVKNGCDSVYSNILKVDIFPNILNNRVNTSKIIVCEGDTTGFDLTGTVPVGGGGKYIYEWQSSLDSVNWTKRGDSLNLKSPAIADTTYFRRVVKSLCYQDTSNTVVVNYAYKFGRNEIGPNSTNCVGDSTAVIRGTSPSRTTAFFKYQWIVSTDSINWARIDTLGDGKDYKVGIQPEGRYFFRRLVDNGCSLDSGNMVLINMVNPILNNTIKGAGNFCIGDSLPTLVGTVPDGGGGDYRYEWQSSTDNRNWFLSAKEKDFKPQSLVRSTLFRRIAEGTSCGKDTSNVIQIRISNPLSNNNITDNQNICVGTILRDTLRGTKPEGGDSTYVYIWQATTDSVWRSVASGRDFLPRDIIETTQFRRIVLSGCYADTSNIIRVTISQRITNNFILSAGQTICQKAKADTLKATVPIDGSNIFKYQWQQSRNQTTWTDIPNANTQDLIFAKSPDSTYYYRRVVTSLCFTSISPSERILVLPTPRITAGRDTIVNIGFSIRLQAGGGIKYLWTPKADFGEDSTAAEPLITPLRTTEYIVRGEDSRGCVGFDTILVVVADDPLIRPVDIITPNGDGLNDVFHIDGIERYPDNLLIVVNRWGSEVYRKKDYKGDWDGTYNGSILPTGVYFFILSVKGTSKVKQGAIHLLE